MDTNNNTVTISNQKLGKYASEIERVKSYTPDQLKAMGETLESALQKKIMFCALDAKIEFTQFQKILDEFNTGKASSGKRNTYRNEIKAVNFDALTLISHLNFIGCSSHEDINEWELNEVKLFAHSLKKSLDSLGKSTGGDSPDNIGWMIPLDMYFIDVDKVQDRKRVNEKRLLAIGKMGWNDGSDRVYQYSTRHLPVTKSDKGHHTELSKYIPMVKKVKIEKFLDSLIKEKSSIRELLDREEKADSETKKK
jgi:hypothetical protein